MDQKQQSYLLNTVLMTLTSTKYIKVLEDNEITYRTYKKAEFKKEALFRDFVKIDYKYYNVSFMSMINGKTINNMKKIPRVIPCYNSRKTISSVVKEIKDVMEIAC